MHTEFPDRDHRDESVWDSTYHWRILNGTEMTWGVRLKSLRVEVSSLRTLLGYLPCSPEGLVRLISFYVGCRHLCGKGLEQTCFCFWPSEGLWFDRSPTEISRCCFPGVMWATGEGSSPGRPCWFSAVSGSHWWRQFWFCYDPGREVGRHPT